jgi:carbon-monoxide dehydrogenase medium subunit
MSTRSARRRPARGPVKPAAFEYVAPRELGEVLALLAELGDDAKILAGGQTLAPMLNLRVIAPGVIIDINRVEGLELRRDDDGLALGTLVRQSTLEDDAGLASRQPLIAAAVPLIGHRPIRNRGTIGGSLAHADPAAEWGALVLAMDAELIVAHHGAPSRTVAAPDFFAGMLETAIGPQELLVEVRVPPWPERSGWSFRELARRAGDFALAGVACRLGIDAAGRCAGARLALIGSGDRPLRALGAEAVLDGEAAASALFDAVADAAAAEVEPFSDLHASAAYRRRLTRVLVPDALDEAHARAGRAGER